MAHFKIRQRQCWLLDTQMGEKELSFSFWRERSVSVWREGEIKFIWVSSASRAALKSRETWDHPKHHPEGPCRMAANSSGWKLPFFWCSQRSFYHRSLFSLSPSFSDLLEEEQLQTARNWTQNGSTGISERHGTNWRKASSRAPTFPKAGADRGNRVSFSNLPSLNSQVIFHFCRLKCTYIYAFTLISIHKYLHIYIYGYIYIYICYSMDINSELVSVLLEDTFHFSPFNSLFPDPHAERQNKPPHFQGWFIVRSRGWLLVQLLLTAEK